MWGLAAMLAVAASPLPLRITYLANEGVLIGGSCAVLVDALMRDSLGSYARHPPDVQANVEAGRPPFDVDLALATHFHLDHWDPGAVSRFLGSRPSAVFASTPEATAMMPYTVRERAKALRPSDGPARIEASGARVEALALEHGRTPHVGYRIDCGGRVLMHLGDATPSPANFAVLAGMAAPEVALLPFWWLLDDGGLAFVRDRWKPKHVVAFHIGADDEASVPRLRAAMPAAWICTKQGQSRTY